MHLGSLIILLCMSSWQNFHSDEKFRKLREYAAASSFFSAFVSPFAICRDFRHMRKNERHSQLRAPVRNWEIETGTRLYATRSKIKSHFFNYSPCHLKHSLPPSAVRRAYWAFPLAPATGVSFQSDLADRGEKLRTATRDKSRSRCRAAKVYYRVPLC